MGDGEGGGGLVGGGRRGGFGGAVQVGVGGVTRPRAALGGCRD